jgi:hypothetical protein
MGRPGAYLTVARLRRVLIVESADHLTRSVPDAEAI